MFSRQNSLKIALSCKPPDLADSHFWGRKRRFSPFCPQPEKWLSARAGVGLQAISSTTGAKSEMAPPNHQRKWGSRTFGEGVRNRVHNPCWLGHPVRSGHRETGVAISLSHCVSYGIADYCCYTPTSFRIKMAYRNPKTDLSRGLSQKKLASEDYRAIGGVARNSIANRALVGH